jgi:hypothetical protein
VGKAPISNENLFLPLELALFASLTNEHPASGDSEQPWQPRGGVVNGLGWALLSIEQEGQAR